MRKRINGIICLALCVALICGAWPASADSEDADGGVVEPVTPVTVEEPVAPVNPEPDPTEEPDPTPVPAPDPTPEPTAEPTPEPVPIIDPEPEPTAKPKSAVDPEKLSLDALEAGTLGDRLSEMGLTDEQFPLVEHLTVASGTIGASDFDCVRKMTALRTLTMTGASVSGDSLPDGALEDLGELREVYLPVPGKKETDRSRVTEIGARAFKDCAKLSALSGLAGIVAVGDSAFSGCAKLQKAKMSSLTSVGERAFEGCAKLSEFDFSELRSIGGWAFSGCAALKSVSLSSAGDIGDGAFSGCAALTSLKIGAKGASIGDGAFRGCGKLSSASLGKASVIGAYAFEGCKELTSISLTNCSDLGEGAFEGCRKLEKAEWPKSFESAGPDSFDGCALDFSKGFPRGLNAAKAGQQRPRVYFSLSEKSGTVYVGDDWDPPTAYLRTRRGTSFKSIIGDDWVNPNVELPKVTRKPKNVYTDEPGKQTIRYTIPSDVFANDHEIRYTLNVIEYEPDPTPTPTPTPAPRPTLSPEVERPDATWATLAGLTLAEMELAIEREVFDPEIRGGVQDFALQKVYPVDLTLISAEEALRVPLVSLGYQVGELVVTRSVDDPETPDFEEESGLTFSLEAAENAELFEATLQIAVLPEQLDPYLAQRPDEALPMDMDGDSIAPSIDEDQDEEADMRSFYPLDALLDVDGMVLLYVNVDAEYEPEDMSVFAMDLPQREALTELMREWIIPAEDDADPEAVG